MLSLGLKLHAGSSGEHISSGSEIDSAAALHGFLNTVLINRKSELKSCVSDDFHRCGSLLHSCSLLESFAWDVLFSGTVRELCEMLRDTDRGCSDGMHGDVLCLSHVPDIYTASILKIQVDIFQIGCVFFTSLGAVGWN